jgi:hypothetical protein
MMVLQLLCLYHFKTGTKPGAIDLKLKYSDAIWATLECLVVNT